MKKIMSLAAVFFISLFFTLHAQSLSIESVCADLSKNKITKGQFIQQKTLAKNGRTLKSNGNFIFSTEGIVWATQKPFPSTLVLGENYMIKISSDGTRTVMDANGNDAFKNISSTLLAVFSNDVSKIEQSFKVSFNSDSNLWTVNLEPKDATVASFMSSILLKGKSSSENSEITDIELNEAKGGKVCYEFFNQTHPKELTADEKTLFNNK